MNNIIIFFLLVSFDLISKFLVKKNLQLNESIEINNYLDFIYVQNYGISFGLFSGQISHWLLIIIGLIIVSIIFYLMINSNKSLEKKAFFLISIGAIGNITDRAINSYVVDFISLHYETYFWPTFNLADIYITIGIIMLLTSYFIKTEDS